MLKLAHIILCLISVFSKVKSSEDQYPVKRSSDESDYVSATNIRNDRYTEMWKSDIRTTQKLLNFVPPIIPTNYGEIRGIRIDIEDSHLPAVVGYLGVPYAQPPVDYLRWKKPINLNSWSGKYHNSLQLKIKSNSVMFRC